MAESKKLVLVFKNSIGKEVTFTIEDPKDALTEAEIDRKSVVQGKSVDLGGRRIIKKIFFQAEDGIRDKGM